MFDQDNITTEGTAINDLMTQYGLTSIIHEPTHLLRPSSSNIDRFFTQQDNLLTNSGVHSTSDCHHQIIYSEFNLRIHNSPLHEHFLLEYDKTTKDLITKSIDAFDWDKIFQRDVLTIKR